MTSHRSTIPCGFCYSSDLSDILLLSFLLFVFHVFCIVFVFLLLLDLYVGSNKVDKMIVFDVFRVVSIKQTTANNFSIRTRHCSLDYSYVQTYHFVLWSIRSSSRSRYDCEHHRRAVMLAALRPVNDLHNFGWTGADSDYCCTVK